MKTTRPGNRRDSVPVIGLIGDVGAGKSTVAAALHDLGSAVLDADRAVGALLAEPVIRERIAAEVAPEALRGGRIDRAALAAKVFADPCARRALEAILHPPVILAAEALVASPPAGATAVVLDAPLLLEAGMDGLCDEVWYVTAPVRVRQERVEQSRGWTPAELGRRESAQLPAEEKQARADRVIHNGAGPRELADAVTAAREAFLAR